MNKKYEEIFYVLNKYKDEVNFDVEGLEEKAKNHLFGIELVEKYGFNIDPKSIYDKNSQELSYYTRLLFMDGKIRKISWSDDNRQPDNEYLIYIGFPTGAYIFGEHYPKETFNKFFNELKNYEPKYVDSANKCLYFTLEKGAKVFNDFKDIKEKYDKISKKEKIKIDIEKKKEELKKLQENE